MQKIQSYEIIGKIGIGGMGSVYKARHEFREGIFAIKSLHPQYAENADIKLRFKNEAKILSKLKHENIVKVEDFFEDSSGLYIVMEFVEGRTLDRMIGREVGPIPFERALPMFMQILDGISFAHQKGIVHRDIKPSNIIVTPDNRIKIADFGIARIGGSGLHTKTGTKMGTLLYMSPEQIRGEHVDERSDIYSLGMTLYEMLAGRHPLRTNEEMSDYTLGDKIVREEFPSPRDFYEHIPQWLVLVVNKAIEKKKEDRFTTVEEFREMIEAGGTNVPIDDEPYSFSDAPTLIVNADEETVKLEVPVKVKPEEKGKIEEKNTKSKRKKQYLYAGIGIMLIVGIYIIAKLSAGKSTDGVYVAENLVHVPKNFLYVEGGSFNMGSNDYANEKPIHRVTVSSFYIGRTEVTVKEYKAYCQATGTSMPSQPRWGWNDSDPVVNVSWNDAQGYCKWAKVRLPTEAEWEYAARGGNKSKGYKYSGSDNIDNVAWYRDNSNSKVHQGGTKQANELGLYDMSGNVWEWCSDWYDENYYRNSPENNPKGSDSGTFRVLRGGSWGYNDVHCRVANRGRSNPDFGNYNYGFRVVQDL